MRCTLLRRSILTLALGGALTAARLASAQSYLPLNLVTDDQTVNHALIADAHLKNPWGISFSPAGSPFWVSDNMAGLSTLYSVNPITNIPAKQGLEVHIPGDGTPTGQAFGGGVGFNGDLFLFASEDGTVSGWRGALGTTAENLVLGSNANVYKGLTFANIGGHGYLYGANFRAGTIDILKGDAGAPNLTGKFLDPTIPSGFAPFNVQKLGNTIYVSYALQDPAKHDDVPGAGNGFVDAYDLQGNFLGRIASDGTLDSPWGLALAPANFGPFGGDLLVGNFGDGRINAFNLAGNTFAGQLLDPNGAPITIDGLWALTVGNNGSGGSASKIYFSAGPNGEANGLFGVIQAVPEPGVVSLAGASLIPALLFLRRRKR